MEQDHSNIFITGATGVMGLATLKELCKFPDQYSITLLSRPSKKNKLILAPYIKAGVNVIWGNLLNAADIETGIQKADIILHIGGMVSPEADNHPKETLSVNIGSMKLIAETVKKIEENDKNREIKTVYIGSVAQYGDHLPPENWIRIGEKLKPSKNDAYSYSKIEAERILATSGLKKWVSLRQTSILHPGLLKKANNPTTFHVPLNGVLEWITPEDSARLMERVCRKNIPESFWCNFYNIGGGESFRLSNYEFECLILDVLGCPSPEKIFEPNWFATKNFHGCWFADSDVLEDILHFRSGISLSDYLALMKKNLPAYYKLTSIVPPSFIKLFMKRLAFTPQNGTLWWIKNNDTEKINSYWGSKEAYDRIKGWDNFVPLALNKTFKEQHKGRRTGTNTDQFSTKFDRSLRRFNCSKGHQYISSEFIESVGGHSCPICMKEITGLFNTKK